MNTPASQQGNFTRYGVYLVLYLIVLGCKGLATFHNKFHIFGMLLFVIVAAASLLFYIRQFNHEQKYFVKGFKLSLLGDYVFTFSATLIIIAARILFTYLQAKGSLPKLSFQLHYINHESNSLYWFLIFAIGIVFPALQQYLTNGFFFNYFFRDSTMINSALGIMASGAFFSLLNFQFSFLILIANFLFGMFFAWSYLYTQSLWMPVYLSILNGILMIILI
ncbi:CPBP family intramembrane glutamic endopeptidase [Lactobacillus sp. PV034]|uniref:CPBP family intramembrane glutamic endopeptidase n=1 Tax=Lactobacillus sp. PV034 TaxID=2594495 RepID=UPI003A0FC4ED|nr:CPBP family intramembrane metalloprotease [Lactobacillus sp. PV034]